MRTPEKVAKQVCKVDYEIVKQSISPRMIRVSEAACISRDEEVANELERILTLNEWSFTQKMKLDKIRVLVEQFYRKEFSNTDARYLEMLNLKEALQINGELSVWAGLVVDLVPIDSFRFDPKIRGYEKIYDAEWMAHDVFMSANELQAKYPYQIDADGKATGIAPDDLRSFSTGEKTKTQGWYGADTSMYLVSREKGKGPTPNPESKAEHDRLLVREIWSRKDNRVYVIVDTIPYIVASWVPNKTPSQWYPFRVLRLNRVTGQVYGFSDVELMREPQDRINQKRSDENKSRWLALPRGVYNTADVDGTEVTKLSAVNPGEMKGLNLQGAAQGTKISDLIQWTSYAHNPEWFNTLQDEQDINSMSSQPTELGGGLSNPKYAAQIDVAAQGAAISANSRGSIVRKWLEGTYAMIAEILLQELTEDDVSDCVGPAAFWPKIYGQMEGIRIHQEIAKIAHEQVVFAEQMAQLQGMPPLDEIKMQEAEAKARADLCLAHFGWYEPVTRDVIFRRLKCKVTVALNTQADRMQRMNAMQTVASSMQMFAQAAQTAGRGFDPDRFLKIAGTIVGDPQALVGMFPPVPAPMPIPQPAGLPPAVAGAIAPQPGTPAPMPGLPQEVPGAQGSLQVPEQSQNTMVQPSQAGGHHP